MCKVHTSSHEMTNESYVSSNYENTTKTVTADLKTNYDAETNTSLKKIKKTVNTTSKVAQTANWIRILTILTVATIELCDRADLDTSFPTLRTVHFCPLQPEIKVMCSMSTSQNPLQSSHCFAQFSIVYWKTCFWLCLWLSYDIILSYLVKNCIDGVSKRTRKEEMGNTGRKKSPALAK